MENDILKGFLFDKNGEFTRHEIEMKYVSEEYTEWIRENGYFGVYELGDLDLMGLELYARNDESDDLPRFLIHLWSIGAARNDDCLFANDFISLNALLREIEPFINFSNEIRKREEKIQRELEEKERW